MLLYNREYMEKAGFDPSAKVFSYDDYRAAAKKITQLGAGKYYGVIIGGNQLNRWGDVVNSMAALSGASNLNDIDHRTGEYFYARDEVVAAMELLLAMKADGSFFPGYLSINAPQARAQIAQGAAGIILQGLWCLPQWKTENPTFKYGAAHTPVATPSKIIPRHVAYASNNEMWLYSKSKAPEVAADIVYYWVSLEGQYAWNAVAGVSDPGILPEALETASTDPIDVKALQIQNGMFKVGPSQLIRNPETAKVALEIKSVTPNFNEVIQGLMAGQLTDAKKQFKDLKDRADKELDRAIKAAKDKGAKVDRSDWVFKNWDPLKDYTEADYKAA
jgi:multiple sugar transport system substrate-binding protein